MAKGGGRGGRGVGVGRGGGKRGRTGVLVGMHKCNCGMATWMLMTDGLVRCVKF